MNNIENNSKEKQSMNPIVKYLIIALTAVGITGVAVFGVYRNNQIKEAATQQEVIVDNDATDPSLLNDKSGQETVDFESLCKGWYDTHQSEIKEDTTWDEWYAQGKVFWQDTNKSEEDTLSGLLAYFAPDTITAEEVTEPESIEVTVDEDVKAIVDAEVHGNDEATDEATAEESVETVEVEASEATAEASTTEISTDTVKQDKHDYEIEYKDTPETMYAVKGVNVRKGPATDYDKVKTLSVNEKIEVIGIVSEVDDEETYWVVYKDKDGNELFVSGAYVDTKPIAQTSSSSGSGNTSSNNNTSNNSTQSSGSQQQSSGNSSAWDILNSNVNHDYSTSGTIDTGDVTEGANWAP